MVDEEIINLTSLDRKILMELQKDARHSLRTLSRLTESSVTAVKNHLKKLTDTGVIKYYAAVVECSKIGYKEMMIISLRLNTYAPVQDILIDLQAIDKINCIYQISGEFPILLVVKCISKSKQIEMIETIKRIKGIEEVKTEIVMDRIKEDVRLAIPMV